MPLGSSSSAPVMRPGPSFCRSGTWGRMGVMRSILEVDPQRGGVRRSAVPVVSGIGDVLPVRAQPGAAKYPPAVEALENALGGVIQPPVTEEETLAAGGKVVAMRARKAVHVAREADAVFRTAPRA